MPFEKVETAGRFPGPGARRPGVLAAPAPSSSCARRTAAGRVVLSRRPHHRQQSDGRPPRLGPHLQGRLSSAIYAMTGHELRYQNGFDCQGLWVEVEVEKELKLQSKRDIENLVPGDTFASIDQLRAGLCKDRVDKYAAGADRAVDPPRLLDGLGPRRGLGRSRRTSGAAISRCRRRTTTRSGASSRSATTAAWSIAATTPCRGVRAAPSA